MNPTEDMLDLVNEQDEVIGTMHRNEVYEKGLRNFRVVNCFIVNSEGKLWIPRRGPHKRIFPNGLDMSMGGHVDSGETYDIAFKRELQEELNLDADILGYEYLGKLTPAEHDVSAFMQAYKIHLDTEPAYNPDDFTEGLWLTPQELMDRLANGDTSKEDLPKLVKHFFLS